MFSLINGDTSRTISIIQTFADCVCAFIFMRLDCYYIIIYNHQRIEAFYFVLFVAVQPSHENILLNEVHKVLKANKNYEKEEETEKNYNHKQNIKA